MLLAIDTATEWVGLALYDGDCVRSEMGWRTRAGHTVELTPSLVRMLAREDTPPQALSAIAISLGPGSFTGLRIGLSLGKALAYALGIPLVGIPTLDILAYSAHRQPFPICALIRAGRGRIAAGFYRQGEGWGPKGAHLLTTLELLAGQVEEPMFFLGELDGQDRALLTRLLGEKAVLASPAFAVRRAGYLAELGWEKVRRGEADPPETLTPIYLH